MSVRTDIVNLNVNVNGNKAQADLNNLRKRAADVKFEMDGLKKGTAEYIAKKKELAGITDEMAKLKKQIGITALTQKELVKELNTMKSLKASMQPFTDEWKKLDKEIKKVESRLYDVRNGVKGFSSFFSKIKDEVKQFGTLAAGYLGFQFLSSQFTNIISGAAKLSDQLGDIQRVTGLTSFEVERLNSQLTSLDTRTSTAGLREIAIIAGKLGIAKDDIFAFTKAVDQLVVALGDELGDANQITTELGKILNVFDGKVTGDNITFLGNAIVDLANKGVASGAFIVDFTQRLAGLAETANLTLDASIGLAAALEETGQRSESASTAVIKLLGELGNDVTSFAKAAGKNVTEFAKTIREKPVEALLQLAEGVVANKTGLQELSPAFKELGIDGVRVQTVLGVLGGKADFFREKIKDAGIALKETSAIQQAFQIKNNTFGAELEKLGKNIRRLFVSSGVSDFFKDIVGGINSMLTPAKTAIQRFEELSAKVQHLEGSIIPLAKRYDELKAKTTLNVDEQAEMKSIISQITAVIPSAVTQFDQYGRAIAISTDRVREFVATEQARLKVVNADAITDYNKKLAKTVNELTRIKSKVDEIAKTGQLGVTDVFVSGGTGGAAVSTKQRKATQEEIASVTNKYADLLELKRGYEAEISRLNGTALKEQLDAEQKAADERRKRLKEEQDKEPSGSPKDDKLDRLKKEADEFAAEIARLRRQVEIEGMAADEAEVARIEDKYAELLKRAKKYSYDIIEIRKLEVIELDRILTKFEKDRIEKAKKAAEKKADQEAEAQARGIDRRFKNDMRYTEHIVEENNKRAKQQKKQDEKDADESQERLKTRIRNIVEYAQAFFGVLEAIANYASKKDQVQLERDRRVNEQKKKNYERLLNSKLLSEAQYNIKIAQLEEELAGKEREIKRRQAKREKALNIFQSLINTASAVAEALPNIPLSIAVGIAGAIQTALIASTPLPELGLGAWIKKGDKHKDPSRGITARIERDEAVMSANAMTDSRRYAVFGNVAQITSALNSKNGGANWAGGAKVVEMPAWVTKEPAQIDPAVPAIVAGSSGIASSSPINLSNTDTILLQLLAEQKNNTEEIKNMKTKLHAVVSIKEYREMEKMYDSSKKASSLNG